MNITTWTRPFPATLLDEPAEIRQHYFKDKIVAHRNIVEAHKILMSTLAHPIEGQIVMVIGAAGVGKTTIRKTMVRDLTAQFLERTDRHPSQIPVAGIELEAFHSGLFKWKKTRQMLLKALHEPAVDKKVIYHPRIKDNHGELKIDNRVSVDDLGEILVEVLAYRKPRALWFDEGQHLIKVSGAKGLLNQLDVMKSLANRSEVVPVLFGTYEMNILLGLSSQLDRRIHRIHVPRYKANVKQDVEEFQRVLLGFQKHLPFPDEPILLDHWAYFFEGSLGCIGLLKDWLYQVSAVAFTSEEKTLTREQCDMWLKDCDVRVDMLHRMTMGESQFVKKHSQIELRVLLGLPYDDVPTIGTDTSLQAQPRNTKPGIRNPIRDKVGNLDHTS